MTIIISYNNGSKDIHPAHEHRDHSNICNKGTCLIHDNRDLGNDMAAWPHFCYYYYPK